MLAVVECWWWCFTKDLCILCMLCTNAWGCSVQAALQEVVCVGVTPRELSMMALAALMAWQSHTGPQQTGLLPTHLAGAVRGWMGQHDSRVSSGKGTGKIKGV